MVTDGVVYNSNEERVITNLSQLQPRRKNTIVLTFDDGPSKHLTDFLDILKVEKVPAMFFWQTRLLHHKRPWQRVIDEGHVIASHTNRHPDLTRLDDNQQKKELIVSKRKIEQLTKKPVRYFRPPFGQYNESTLEIASILNLQTVMWHVTSYDWELKSRLDGIIQNVTNHVQDGSIVLLHELKQTLCILPALIKKLREKGFDFTTM